MLECVNDGSKRSFNQVRVHQDRIPCLARAAVPASSPKHL
jgi:hypothetical protein